MTTITLSPAELATVLAALRYWQAKQSGKPIDIEQAAMLADIASDGGEMEPLDADAIDALCERINTAHAPRIAVVLEGGTVQSVVTDSPVFVGLKVMVVDYDTDSIPDDETIAVPQDNGGTARASRMGVTVQLATVGLKEVDDTIEWEG